MSAEPLEPLIEPTLRTAGIDQIGHRSMYLGSKNWSSANVDFIDEVAMHFKVETSTMQIVK